MKRHGPFKLKRRSFVLFYDIHSWTGVIGGMVFFICCFSGTLALFERELIVWENPAARASDPGETLEVDVLFQKALDHLGDIEKGIFVELPTSWNGSFHARASGEDIDLEPSRGGVIESPETTAFAFLTHLHTDLHLPRPLGRYLVGLIGIFMMISLITGVMAHPKVLKEMFLLRWRPSLRLSFSDLHKQLGVWSLVFGLVLSFTGAALGLLGLFAPVMVLSAFGGDVGKASEAFSGPKAEPTGTVSTMRSIGALIEETERRHPEFVVRSFFVRHYGDEAAEIALHLERAPYDKLAAGETHRLSLVTGELLHVASFTGRGSGARLFGAVQPLHYGLFGGMGMKLLYFLSGIILSLGIATGSLIWLERRQRSSSREAESGPRYVWLGRLTLGVCLGLVLASALAIAAGRFAPSVVQGVFWGSWVAAIVTAFLVPNGFVGARFGGFLTAAVLAGVASADLVGSEVLLPGVLQVDLVLLVLAFLIAGSSAFIPNGPAKKKQQIERATDLPSFPRTPETLSSLEAKTLSQET